MNSVRVRILAISVLPVIPVLCLGLAMVSRLHEADRSAMTSTFYLAMVALLAVGMLAAFYAAHLAVVAPLRRLTSQVELWQQGKEFRSHPGIRDPEEISALSRSFTAATAELGKQKSRLLEATARQELLMQEIHHRVKNNLQIVASLLNLQASRIRQPQARAEFQAARDRVRALATLHRHLYAHGEVHTINMREFLNELCGQLLQAMGEIEGTRIRLSIDASEIQMSSDQAVPLALIVTEAVSNSFKFAFPEGRSGTVAVHLSVVGDTAELTILDDGIGIPASKSGNEDGRRDGIGLQLINGFARQLGATLVVTEGQGTRYIVTMPIARERTPSPNLGPVTPGPINSAAV